MSALWKLPYLFIILVANAFSAFATDSAPVTIKYGTSFGNCSGYCLTEIEVSSKRVVFRATGHLQIERVTPANKTDKLNGTEWREIIRLVDKRIFLALPLQIGCPDCADGGAEWIEVTFRPAETKRVTYEHRNAPSEIRELAKALNEVHSRFQLPNSALKPDAPKAARPLS